MKNKFSIIDAVTDSTFGCKQYDEFKKKYGFDGLKMKSLDDELNLPLEHIFLFAKQGDTLYLIRSVTERYMGLASETDVWTAVVIKEKKLIPMIQYPSILTNYVDPWIKENKKEA